MEITIFGGINEHVNYAMNYAKKCKKYGIADMTGKNKNENYAEERQMIGLDVLENFMVLYTNIGAPIATLFSESVKTLGYISSNKHNACPLVICRSKTRHLLWHISYKEMIEVLEKNQSMRILFPQFLNEVQIKYPQFSLMSLFDDPATEFLVTNKRLLEKNVLGVKGTIKILHLPSINIISSGLEGSIRSYSVSYFFDNDDTILILSGEGSEGNSLWSMKNPFTTDAKWEFINTAEKIFS